MVNNHQKSINLDGMGVAWAARWQRGQGRLGPGFCDRVPWEAGAAAPGLAAILLPKPADPKRGRPTGIGVLFWGSYKGWYN